MKPCKDPATILRLMQRHQELAEQHKQHLDSHNERILKLREYYREISRPGFKRQNEWIQIPAQSFERFVVTAGDTYK